jgi:hypothetical protein
MRFTPGGEGEDFEIQTIVVMGEKIEGIRKIILLLLRLAAELRNTNTSSESTYYDFC